MQRLNKDNNALRGTHHAGIFCNVCSLCVVYLNVTYELLQVALKKQETKAGKSLDTREGRR